jgi:hypothetical protein
VAPEAVERGEEGGGGGVDRQVGHVDLPELEVGGVDVDEHLRGLRHLGDGVAVGRHLAEAGADSEDEVGAAQRLADGGEHADARFAEIVRVLVVVEVVEAEGGEDGEAEARHLAGQERARLGRPAAAAHERHGPLGPVEERLEFGHRMGFGRGLGHAGPAHRRRGRAGGQHVLGQGDDDGAGAARKCRCPRSGNNFRNSCWIVYFHGPFGDGAEKSRIVDFLERLAALHVGADLAHEEDHGRGILPRRMDANRGVRRAGASGDEAEAGLAGELAVGFGHEGRAAFVAGAHETEARGVMHGVEKREIAFARHAEAASRAEGEQAVHQDLAAGSRVRHGPSRGALPRDRGKRGARGIATSKRGAGAVAGMNGPGARFIGMGAVVRIPCSGL